MSQTTKPPEVRALSLYGTPPEVRADDEARKLTGYAAVFNSRSVDLGGFREIIAPGAFAAVLQSGEDIRALVDHDHSRILGRTSAGTLRLREDSQGLADEIDLPATSYANDLLVSIRRKDISGQSFGFYVEDDDWVWVDDILVRTLLRVRLTEVTITSIPAYTDTSVGVRGAGLLIPDEVRNTASKCRRFPRRARAERLLKIAAA